MILTERCEINVVHHCNLSCQGCSHIAHKAEKFTIDPDQVHRDLALLRRWYRPERVSLLGGEPLLHPDLLGVVAAVRRSGVAERIRVLTNGILLNEMPDAFWRGIDEICVSLHPGREIAAAELRDCSNKAKKHRVNLELRCVDQFREPYAEAGTADEEAIRRIHATCLVAHDWRCHTVHEGYLFPCPPSLLIPLLVRRDSTQDAYRDGIRITNNASCAEELQGLMSRTRPLHACRYCLGSVGKRFANVQRARDAPQVPRRTEDLIDRARLEYLERSRRLTHNTLGRRTGFLCRRALASLPPRLQLNSFVRRTIRVVRNIQQRWQ